MSNEAITTDIQEDERITTADLVRQSQRLHEAPSTESHEPLFPAEESERFRNRWNDIQGSFVDEPRNAVEQADELVASVIKRLASVFADERGGLETAWAEGNDVSTEDLRQALRRYRSFFDRLLSV